MQKIGLLGKKWISEEDANTEKEKAVLAQKRASYIGMHASGTNVRQYRISGEQAIANGNEQDVSQWLSSFKNVRIKSYAADLQLVQIDQYSNSNWYKISDLTITE